MSKYNLSARKLIKLLEKDGFHFIRQNGSHAIYKNFRMHRKVIVPVHGKDIPKGTASAIIRDAGLTLKS